jgi:hypothetical protein
LLVITSGGFGQLFQGGTKYYCYQASAFRLPRPELIHSYLLIGDEIHHEITGDQSLSESPRTDLSLGYFVPTSSASGLGCEYQSDENMVYSTMKIGIWSDENYQKPEPAPINYPTHGSWKMKN